MKTKSNPSLRGARSEASATKQSISKNNIDCHDFANAKSRNDEIKHDESPYKSHNDKNYRRFAIFFVGIFSIASLATLALVALLYIYDPLQIYHKPYFREITFLQDSRIQIRGIIKNYDFDSFICGTSMLENTLAKEAEQKISGKWVNFSSGGFAFNERAIILNYMFKNAKPKNIIYSLDIEHLVINHQNDTKNFAFLYDDNELNDLKIYLNTKTISCALRLSTSEDCVGKKDLENLISLLWIKNIEHKARFGGIHKWLENKDNVQIKDTIKELANMSYPPLYNPKPFTDSIQSNQKYLEENLLVFVRQNPRVKFFIVIPTYSRLFYRLNDEFQPKAKVILKWLVSQNLPNMKIYGFDDLDYADDIANYKDLTHYNVDMNSMQLDAIASGTHILTPQNIDSYLATMESKIKNYDITPLIEQIKAWEAQNKSN